MADHFLPKEKNRIKRLRNRLSDLMLKIREFENILNEIFY